MEGVDTAAEVLTQEIPEVIQQLLLWHSVYSLLNTLISVSILVIMYVVLKKYCGVGELIAPSGYGKKYRETITHDKCGELDIQAAVTALISFAVFCGAMANLDFTWLKILIAPKVWLLEYAAKLAG